MVMRRIFRSLLLLASAGACSVHSDPSFVSEDSGSIKDTPQLEVAEAERTDAPVVDTQHLAEQEVPASVGARLQLGDVRIVPNPNNILSCFLEWETDVVASSYVDFGPDGSYAFRIRAAAPGRSHRILVIGLYSGATWNLRAVSFTDAGRVGYLDTLSFTPEPLPADVPAGALIEAATSEALDGWTLTQLGRGNPWDVSPSVVVMYDMRGRPVWYYRHPEGPAGLASLVGDGTILTAAGSLPQEVNLEGEVTWTSPAEPPGPYTWWDSTAGGWHHEFSRLPNGNYGVLRVRDTGIDGKDTDTAEEMSRDGEILWQFDTAPLAAAKGFYIYGTALTIDLEADVAWYTSRNAEAIYKIDRKSGEVIWTLGHGGTFAPSGTNWDRWFAGPHSTRILGDDRVLIFDVGPIDQSVSRAIQLQLDRTTETASLVWAYPPTTPPEPWHAPGGGSAQPLPNGNILLAAIHGSDPDNLWDFSEIRLMEVTQDARRVWFLKLPRDLIIYRAERIQPPGIERLGGND